MVWFSASFVLLVPLVAGGAEGVWVMVLTVSEEPVAGDWVRFSVVVRRVEGGRGAR